MARYRGLSLQAGQVRRGATSPVAGHLESPEFAFDPDVDSLMICGLAFLGQDVGERTQ